MFETDEIERQLVEHPGLAKRNLKRKLVLNTIFCIISFGIMSIGTFGIFLGAVVAMMVLFDSWVFLRAWGDDRDMKRGKRTLLFLAWLAGCALVGYGIFFLIKFAITKGA
nr:hypothetical protein [bacterium]